MGVGGLIKGVRVVLVDFYVARQDPHETRGKKAVSSPAALPPPFFINLFSIIFLF